MIGMQAGAGLLGIQPLLLYHYRVRAYSAIIPDDSLYSV